ncbi:MAG: hypothetical protein KA399_04800 [Chitinophagaceae bacterium]|nr:hypothetical protein [Chitinophagaceae bacterium]
MSKSKNKLTINADNVSDVIDVLTELSTATLDGPKTDGNKAVYSVKTTVGTKG